MRMIKGVKASSSALHMPGEEGKGDGVVIQIDKLIRRMVSDER